MKNFIWIAFVIGIAGSGLAQPLPAEPTSSLSPVPAASSPAADVDALRQQVQALTETVKALQEQVKQQQATLEKANLTGAPSLPKNAETPGLATAKPNEPSGAAAQPSPSPAASAPSLFPTED